MSNLPAALGGEPEFADFIPIVNPWLPAFDELEEEIREIVNSGMLTKGQHLADFENAMAEHLGVRHAIAVSSCTVGLILLYRAAGLSGQVVVPSFTFMATVSSLFYHGLNPVFSDVDIHSTNLDPEKCGEVIDDSVSAIVAVHNFGVPAPIEELQAIADANRIPLLFDAAHGLGSLHGGAPLGGQGQAQVFSLSPTKLVIAGEGGIVATNDNEIAEGVRIGREYGNAGDYDSALPGLNGRMPEVNALIGLESLGMLAEAVRNRNRTAEEYRERLGALPGLVSQAVPKGDRSSYKDFSIRITEEAFGLSRDALAASLRAEGIDTRAYYDPPVHKQTAYRDYAPGTDSLSNTERLAMESLSLPIWSKMPSGHVDRICSAVECIHAHADRIANELR